jgi:hypothetical protein
VLVAPSEGAVVALRYRSMDVTVTTPAQEAQDVEATPALAEGVAGEPRGRSMEAAVARGEAAVAPAIVGANSTRPSRPAGEAATTVVWLTGAARWPRRRRRRLKI